MGRTIVIGDVHGCLTELQELLQKLRFDPSRDFLACVGDVVDKGPDSLGVVRLLQGLGATVVLGDHEHAYVQHHLHKTPLTLEQRALYASFSEDDIDWLLDLPAFFDLGTWDHAPCYVVHGGFEPGLSLHQQKPENLCRTRFVSEEGLRIEGAGHFTSQLTGGIVRRTPKNGHRWYQSWTDSSVVYSHAHRSGTSVTADSYGCFCVDTGCVYGGKLSALILADDGCHDVVQVQAHRSYVEPQSAAA